MVSAGLYPQLLTTRVSGAVFSLGLSLLLTPSSRYPGLFAVSPHGRVKIPAWRLTPGQFAHRRDGGKSRFFATGSKFILRARSGAIVDNAIRREDFPSPVNVTRAIHRGSDTSARIKNVYEAAHPYYTGCPQEILIILNEVRSFIEQRWKCRNADGFCKPNNSERIEPRSC